MQPCREPADKRCPSHLPRGQSHFLTVQARRAPGMTGQRENLAASFPAVHQNFPHFLCGEIPLFGRKVHAFSMY